jgi:acetolactate synthase-1/2/3 large subunit
MSTKIKISDYVAEFLSISGIDTVFAVSGGASLHLMHSVSHHPGLKLICPHHEQAAAMAADGYSRIRQAPGVAIATSGPGATNLITGICSAFYDSIPLICITGQVSTFRMVGDTGVRQVGFQETPIVDMVAPITKYAVTVADPLDIGRVLKEALSAATSGRNGPVLVDIPDNLQREVVSKSEIEKRCVSKNFASANTVNSEILSKIEEIFDLLKASKRPVVIAGWGVHLSKSEKKFVEFVKSVGAPVVCTWAGADILDRDDELYLGTFGTHGMRHSNIALQHADLIISVGARLDTKATGTPVSGFAPNAKKIVIDIDQYELSKFSHFGLDIDVAINVDLPSFFSCYLDQQKKSNFFAPSCSRWRSSIEACKTQLRDFDETLRDQQVREKINPYEIFRNFFETADARTICVLDTGCTIAWAMQSIERGTRATVIHDYNNTAMGWALPAAIGASFASAADFNTYCFIGDGSIMMTAHELATISKHKLPIKIFVMNNGGYSMIKQTQEQWLNSKYVGSSGTLDLSFPDFGKLADAFGINYESLSDSESLRQQMDRIRSARDPMLVNVDIDTAARVIPQVKFGRPNDDMEPLLEREEYEKIGDFFTGI